MANNAFEIGRDETVSTALRVARSCFPETQQGAHSFTPHVDHSGEQALLGSAPTALEFFLAAHCNPTFINTLFNPDGSWREQPVERLGIYQMSVAEIDETLERVFTPVYGLANDSLDHIYHFGFNRHDLIHIRAVRKRCLQLLTQSGATPDQLRLAAIASWAHDEGNPFSRKYHSLISPVILEKQLPEICENPQYWRLIRRAIELHNEPIATALIASWQKDGKLSEAEIISKMHDRFGPIALALIIGDKVDLGRHRISMKATAPEALADQFLEINLLGRTTSVRFDQEQSVISWEIAFAIGKASELEGHENLQQFMTPRPEHRDGERAIVSNRTQQMLRENGYSYMGTWCQMFGNLYYERILLTVRSALALFPDAKTFKIKIADDDGMENREYSFHRHRLAEDFTLFARKFNRHKEKSNGHK